MNPRPQALTKKQVLIITGRRAFLKKVVFVKSFCLEYIRFIILINLLAVVYLVGSFFYGLKDPPEAKTAPSSHVKDTIQIVTGCLTLVTLFYAILNYEYSKSKTKEDLRKARETLTYNIATEWHKPAMVDNQKKVVVFRKDLKELFEDTPRFVDWLRKPENIDYSAAVTAILNYFESVSLAYEQGLIEPAFIRKFFEGLFCSYYASYESYITFRRSEISDDTVYIYFTGLATFWEEDRKVQTELRIESLQKNEEKRQLLDEYYNRKENRTQAKERLKNMKKARLYRENKSADLQ